MQGVLAVGGFEALRLRRRSQTALVIPLVGKWLLSRPRPAVVPRGSEMWCEAPCQITPSSALRAVCLQGAGRVWCGVDKRRGTGRVPGPACPAARRRLPLSHLRHAYDTGLAAELPLRATRALVAGDIVTGHPSNRALPSFSRVPARRAGPARVTGPALPLHRAGRMDSVHHGCPGRA
jgi:hypothetical protein